VSAFGLGADAVMGRPLAESPIPWHWERIKEAIARCVVSRGPVHVNDLRYWRRDGSEGVIEAICTCESDADGAPRAFTVLATDITERRLLESHLNQSKRLESIGQLAAGVAHEINTPTQFVGDNLSFLDNGFTALMRVLDAQSAALASGSAPARMEAAAIAAREADLDYLREETPKALQQSKDGIARIADIVGALRTFSHPDNGEKRGIDLNQALQGTLTVARNEYKYVADVLTVFQPDLPPVPCLAGEINQVFLSLIINAAHAIAAAVKGSKRRGTIAITTEATQDMVEVRIADDGVGIPDGIRDRIFDPFFTTKDVGKGTGQGLYLSREIIVSKHGGALGFESQHGKGSTFTVRLPLRAPQSERETRESAAQLAARPSRGSGPTAVVGTPARSADSDASS
jgi:PAS domain S-box-containing protein